MEAKEIVLRLFQQWEAGDSSSFFNALADDVRWTATGNTPISGISHTKAEYLSHTYHPLQKLFGGATSCKVKRVLSDGDHVVVEWHGETPLLKGGCYVNDYCWIIRMAGGKLAEMTGYFDTAAVDALFV